MNKTKRLLSTIIALAIILTLFTGIPIVSAAEPSHTIDEILAGRLLKPFTLTGTFENDKISTFTVEEGCSTYLWNSETEDFELVETTSDAIVGNFVQIWDANRNGSADGLLVVSWEDSRDYWDEDMHWNDDFDDDGAFSDGQEWRLPFGQRLLDEYGIGGAVEDFSNILEYAALQESTYWPLHDYYNATSSETLTMLTGFRTTQQATGWACGPTSALMVMDWFGLRGDLNEEDLANLRQKQTQGGSTNLQQLINIFEGLNTLDETGKGEWGKWDILSSYDIVNEYDITKPTGGKYNLSSVECLMDGSLFIQLLEEGIPIMIGWNSFGGHWQVIVGYDTMGSDDTKDHVLILADPYDSTDHRNDGYNIQSFERFIYDWSAGFDPDFRHGIFVAAVPEGWEYTPEDGDGITDYKADYDGDDSDDMKLGYGRTAADIEKFYPSTPWRGSNGLAGAATGGYERVPNDYVNVSPYYAHYDFYNMKSGISQVGGGNLILLEEFKTIQQATEWTCGLTSSLMAMEWFNANPGLPKLLNAYSDEELEAVAEKYGFDASSLYDDRQTEINLAGLRGEGRTNPGATTLDDLKNIFDNLNKDTEYLNAMALANEWDTLKKWDYICTDDLSEEDLIINGGSHALADGAADDGVIPYYLSLGYPILIGWDEWGGHWQVIIGYDDMGTDETQDDVLILADPYDTTDHNQDGYYLESFERLVYGWGAAFDSRRSNVFFIPYLVDVEIPEKTVTTTRKADTKTEVEPPLTDSFPFTDVDKGIWYYDNVYYMWKNGLMKGTSNTLFSPSTALTRGMAVTVLYRMAGEPDVADLANPFSDVADGLYYTNAIIWAADKGIVLGYGNGKFGPGDNVTREQFAAILCRYQKYTGKVPPDTREALVFADGNLISGYARGFVNALVMQGIINGKDDNRFDPKGNTIRAELAVMLHKYLSAIAS